MEIGQKRRERWVIPNQMFFVSRLYRITKFSSPRNMARLWDLPGAGTKDWPSESYVRDAGLRHFDGVLLVVAGAFSDAEETGNKRVAKYPLRYWKVCVYWWEPRYRLREENSNNCSDKKMQRKGRGRKGEKTRKRGRRKEKGKKRRGGRRRRRSGGWVKMTMRIKNLLILSCLTESSKNEAKQAPLLLGCSCNNIKNVLMCLLCIWSTSFFHFEALLS